MFHVTKDIREGHTEFHLSGIITEAARFVDLFGPVAKTDFFLDCGGVKRVNSVGIRAWMLYFGAHYAAGSKIVYINLPPELVEVMSQIKAFLCGGEIRSFLLPYRCKKCPETFRQLFSSEAVRKSLKTAPAAVCPKCGSASELDDDWSGYARVAKMDSHTG